MSIDLGNGDFMGVSYHKNEKKVLEERIFILENQISEIKNQLSDLTAETISLKKESIEKDDKIKDLKSMIKLKNEEFNFKDSDKKICGMEL